MPIMCVCARHECQLMHYSSCPELLVVLINSLLTKHNVNLSCVWVSPQLPPEEQNVRLWPVDRIVHPSLGLLNSKLPPFHLGQQSPSLRQALSQLLRQGHVPVFKTVVLVLFRVDNIANQLLAVVCMEGRVREEVKERSGMEGRWGEKGKRKGRLERE